MENNQEARTGGKHQNFWKKNIYTIREEFKKKKIQKSDIVQKGRVGWTPKTYF